MQKDLATFADFQKLDFRVGLVLEAEAVTGAENLIRLEVDFGTDYGRRKILTGLSKWYKPRQLKGKKFIFVANLAPKQMMGEESSGMMLCADLSGEPKIIPLPKDLTEGSVIR